MRVERRARWPLALLLAAVFAVKWIVLAQLRDHPLLQPDAGLDAAEYVSLARQVLDGHLLLGPGLYYLSPLYIYFLAAVLAVSDSLFVARVAQIALGTAAVGGIFISADAWFGRRAAWIAATLAALTGVFTFHEIVLFQASLDPFLTSAALACLALALTSADGAGKRAAALPLAGGVLFGFQILNRPNIAIAIGGMLLVLAIARHLRTAAWLAVGLLAALAPVVARNAIVSQQFALASSQGGLNFYIGNNAAATGQYAAVPGVRANIAGQAEDTRRVAEAATGRAMTDAEVSSYFTALGTAWIREHPGDAAALLVRKLALTLNARHQWLDFSYPYYAHDAGSSLWLLFVGPWLLVPLGAAGIVAGAWRSAAPRRAFLAWTSFAPLYAISVAVFFVGERYRLPLFVPLCVCAGGAVDRALQVVSATEPRREIRASMAAAVALLAGIVVVALPLHLPDGRFEERQRLSKVLMNRGDYGGAAVELDRAYALRPDDTVTEFNLGMALVSDGRAREGIAHVQHAVSAGVSIPGARYALASATLATGDRDRAVTLLRTYYPADGDSAESCYQVGVLALNAGAPDVADRYLTRALRLRPGWPEAQEALAAARSGR